MHFWNIKAVAQELKNHAVNQTETMLYSLVTITLFGLGISVTTWLPMIYYYSFSAIKKYLEKQADPAPLNILVFTHLDYFFLLLKIALIVAGILFCLFALNSTTMYTRAKRLICLSVPVNIRFVIFLSVIFIIFFLLCGSYFGYKLLELTNPETTKSGITAIFSKISPASLIRTGWSHWLNFKKAQVIFDQINVMSYVFYLSSHILSIVATLFLFLLICNIMRKID